MDYDTSEEEPFYETPPMTRDEEEWAKVLEHIVFVYDEDPMFRKWVDTICRNVCYENTSTFATDALEMARRAGKREVGLYLRACVDGGTADLFVK